MDDKLIRFFNKINFDDVDNFEGVTVSKVVINKQKESWIVYLQSDIVVNPEAMIKLINKAKDGIENVNTIDIKINYSNILDEDIIIYFKYFLDQKVIDNVSLQSILNNDFKVENNEISVEVISKMEADLIDSFNDEFSKYLKSLGLPEVSLVPVINDEKRKEIKEEIENSKTDIIVNKEPEFKIIMGEEIKSKKITEIKDIIGEENNVTVEAYIFGIEEFVSNKSNFKILTLKISDKTDSILAKIFTREDDEFNKYKAGLKEGKWYAFRGYVKNDTFAKDLVFNVRDIEEIPSKDDEFVDDAEVKRVELHAHTMMSQMDGVTKFDLDKHTSELVSNAIKFGYKGVAITDHGGCQAFPICYEIIKNYNKGKPKEEHFKGIYGTELTLVDDSADITFRAKDDDLRSTTYVVFDTETTGFNAGGKDQMIEIGAVKIASGEIIDRFDEFINPGRPLPQKIVDLTCITDDDLAGADNEANVTKRFLEWAEGLPMVAHNAKFDMSFVDMACKKYGLPEFSNTVIDTLELSRALDPDLTRHSLSALVKRYEVPWNEDAHHRADYDAEGTAYVFWKMLDRVPKDTYKAIKDLDNLVDRKSVV